MWYLLHDRYILHPDQLLTQGNYTPRSDLSLHLFNILENRAHSLKGEMQTTLLYYWAAIFSLR